MALRNIEGLKKRPRVSPRKGQTVLHSSGRALLYAHEIRVRCPACFEDLKDPFTGEPFQWLWAPTDEMNSTGCSRKVVCPCGFRCTIPERRFLARMFAYYGPRRKPDPCQCVHFGANASPAMKRAILTFLEEFDPKLLQTLNTGTSNRTGTIRTPGEAKVGKRLYTHDMKPVKRRLLLCVTRRTGRLLPPSPPRSTRGWLPL